jgi:hypothetical protein
MVRRNQRRVRNGVRNRQPPQSVTVVRAPRLKYYELSASDTTLTGLFNETISFSHLQLWPDLTTAGNRQFKPTRYEVTFSPVNLLTVPVFASLQVYTFSGISSGAVPVTIFANASNQVALSPTLPTRLVTKALGPLERPVLIPASVGAFFQITFTNPTITAGLRIAYTIVAWCELEPDIPN